MARNRNKQKKTKKTECEPTATEQKQTALSALKKTGQWLKTIQFLSYTTLFVSLLAIFPLASNISEDCNLVFFKNISIPGTFEDKGINNEYIKNHLIYEINAALDSVKIKIDYLANSSNIGLDSNDQNKILYEAEHIPVASGESNLKININIFDININGITKAARKKFTSHNDITASIHFTADANRVVASYIFMDNTSKVLKGEIYKNLNSYGNLNECIDNMLRILATHMAGYHNALAPVLSDFHYNNGLEAYEELNPWTNNTLTIEQKKDILSENNPENGTSRPWNQLLMASIYESNGISNNDIGDLKKAKNCYKSLSISGQEQIESIAKQKIENIDKYLSLLHKGNDKIDPILNRVLRVYPETSSFRQIIIVKASSTAKTKATMFFYERNEAGFWNNAFSSLEVNLGAGGIALEGMKREGDFRTPSGLFPISRLFGYKNDTKTKMPFIEITPEHIWVTDTHDSLYNQIIEDTDRAYTGKGERLYRNDLLNKYAIIVDYNIDPVINGNGSAIFIHCERSRNHRTAGCISMPEERILEVINWLSPLKHPHIYICR